MSLSPKSGNTARKPHLVFINYYFPPMGGGGVQRILKFLKYFDHEKYCLTVVTVKTSYSSSHDNTLCREVPREVGIIQSGSLDPFRLIYLFKQSCLKLLPVFKPRKTVHFESGDKRRKMAMTLFVPDSRLLWLPFAVGRIIRLHRKQRIDLLVASMPPFTAGLIGIVSRYFLKKSLVLDFRDAWTNNPYLPPMGFFRQKLNERLEQYCIEKAGGFVFVNPELQKYYLAKYARIRLKSFATIRNGYDPQDFAGIAINNARGKGRLFKLGIMGTIYSRGNRPLSLLQSIRMLSLQIAHFERHFRLVFLGKWTPEFMELIEEEKLTALVEYIPYLPHHEALKVASRFDAVALSLETHLRGNMEVTPGRIYEYLFLKKPILAMCDPRSDVASLVRLCQAGEVVDFADTERIKEVICDWMNNRVSLHHRYRFVAIEKFSRIELTRQFIKFLETVGF